jgi:hypothetical protein
MGITLQKNKLSAYISKGTTEDIQIFTEAINRAINHYLSKDEFSPIMQPQAETIYFLKWLSKCLVLEQGPKDGALANVVISIPNNDFQLLEAFQDSLDRVLSDLFVIGAERGLDATYCEVGFFLSVLRKAVTPSLKDLTGDIRKSLLN